ncbi:hypothetical protein Ddc_21586 [Ditylenchus destructor]|nr:hypothetical protein Ddc_21586 [Ditylenchus destructor]
MPASASAISSSSRRPKTLASPPFKRTTTSCASASRTSAALIAVLLGRVAEAALAHVDPARLGRELAQRGIATRSADQQRAAGAVAGGVHDDQRAADAVVRVGLQRQLGLQLDGDVTDLV